MKRILCNLAIAGWTGAMVGFVGLAICDVYAQYPNMVCTHEVPGCATKTGECQNCEVDYPPPECSLLGVGWKSIMNENVPYYACVTGAGTCPRYQQVTCKITHLYFQPACGTSCTENTKVKTKTEGCVP